MKGEKGKKIRECVMKSLIELEFKLDFIPIFFTYSFLVHVRRSSFHCFKLHVFPKRSELNPVSFHEVSGRIATLPRIKC